MRLQLAEALGGFHPHPRQREFLLDDHPVKVAAFGRRWGKTFALAWDLMSYAVAFPGTSQFVFAPTLDQTEQMFVYMRRIADLPCWGGGITCRGTPYREVEVAGSIIRMRTSGDEARKGARVRGWGAHRVVIDEASRVPEDVIIEVLLPMLADTGGQLILISTPFGKNYFYRRWLQGNAGEAEHDPRCRSWNGPSTDNPHISHAYIADLAKDMSERQFACEVMAEFIEDAAGVFRWEDITACTQGEPAEYDPSRKYTIGVDLGKYRDWSAVCVVDVTKLPARVVHLHRMQRMSWPSQKHRIRSLCREYGWPPTWVDSTGVGDPIADELERTGDSLIGRYLFTAESKRKLVDNLGNFIALHRVRWPRDRILIEELQYFEYELLPSGQVRFHGAGHDDCVCALALALWPNRGILGRGKLAAAERAVGQAASKEKKAITFEEAQRKRRSAWDRVPADLRRAAKKGR